MIEGDIPLYTFRNLSMMTVEEMAMVGSKSGRWQGQCQKGENGTKHHRKTF